MTNYGRHHHWDRGKAGPYAGAAAGGLGHEGRDRRGAIAFGGTCVNTGCTPTKTLVASAYAMHTGAGAAPTSVFSAPAARSRST